MLGTAIIVFREVLEAALIVGIVMAASKGAPDRGRWVSCGIAGGAGGAGIVAVFAASIAAAASGIGQELLNAVILLLAVGCCSPSVCSAGTTSGCPAMGASSRQRLARSATR